MKFYGKYRGRVENNLDPMQLGRVQVSCPAVLGAGTLSWAMPCTPYAGDGVGLFLVPPVGANVWVEFEGGDPATPILAGCFWGVGEVPASPAIAETKMLRTDLVTIEADDLPVGGGLTLAVQPPAVPVPVRIAMTSDGVEITAGIASISVSEKSVSLNQGALEVT